MPTGFDEILARRLPDGGFAGERGRGYRPDATAWAILALEWSGGEADVVAAARDRLAADQRPDGRIVILPGHLGGFWPTALAALAWHGSPAHVEAQRRAADFLLATSGVQIEGPQPFIAHDAMLRGWPWIGHTHSWVEPTAVAILALSAAGEGEHPRVAEGLRLLLDRQLPHGGWNYGNTIVFGQELRPAPESTGPALAALAGRVPAARVAASLAYLEGEVARIRTPLTVGWGLLGLSPWGRRPAGAQRLIDETLAREPPALPFDTAELGVLGCAAAAERGLLAALSAQRRSAA